MRNYGKLFLRNLLSCRVILMLRILFVVFWNREFVAKDSTVQKAICFFVSLSFVEWFWFFAARKQYFHWMEWFFFSMFAFVTFSLMTRDAFNWHKFKRHVQQSMHNDSMLALATVWIEIIDWMKLLWGNWIGIIMIHYYTNPHRISKHTKWKKNHFTLIPVNIPKSLWNWYLLLWNIHKFLLWLSFFKMHFTEFSWTAQHTQRKEQFFIKYDKFCCGSSFWYFPFLWFSMTETENNHFIQTDSTSTQFCCFLSDCFLLKITLRNKNNPYSQCESLITTKTFLNSV